MARFIALVVIAGELEQAPKCRILVEAGPLHHHSLGGLDDLTVGKGLTQLAGLLIGDGDSNGAGHTFPLGSVMMILAPGPSLLSTVIPPPCASTIRLAMAIPRPVPCVFVV